jgi:hypothetical protein
MKVYVVYEWESLKIAAEFYFFCFVECKKKQQKYDWIHLNKFFHSDLKQNRMRMKYRTRAKERKEKKNF